MQPARPLHAHPLDPVRQHEAAAGFGKLVACGLLSPDEALPELVAGAIKAGYRGDVSGLRARLSWTIIDASCAWRGVRDRTVWNIRESIAPMFWSWEPPTKIRHAAARVNEAAGDPLLPRDLAEILDQEAVRAMRFRRRSRG